MSYISSDELKQAFEEDGHLSAYIEEMIDAIPAADVRSVVLCRDCRHRGPEDHKCDSGQLERAGCVFPVGDDYFCADGEKWEGN
jgi:hypothetical protein